MPIYLWKCLSCGETIEVLQKHDDPAPQCENIKCKDSSAGMIKVIGRTSFILKGGGWASTGYSKKEK